MSVSPVSPASTPDLSPSLLEHAWITSLDINGHAYDGEGQTEQEITNEVERDSGRRGLGISSVTSPTIPHIVSPVTVPEERPIRRVPVGSKSTSFGSASSTPTLVGTPLKQTVRRLAKKPVYSEHDFTGNSVSDTGARKQGADIPPFESSLHSSFNEPYTHELDTVPLNNKDLGSTGKSRDWSAYESSFSSGVQCPTHRSFYLHRTGWISILLLSIYSTVFSAIFLVLSLDGPRYGGLVSSEGPLTPSGAIILTSVIAKTIELSFAITFGAFVGQKLSRRAFAHKYGKGFTLAEITTRNLITQPGSLITHFNGLKYALFSFLGVFTLVAAVMTTLYTAAAQALVQPQLRFGNWEPKFMAGEVQASFANPMYLEQTCVTPIQNDYSQEADGSPENVGGETCLQLQYAAQSYQNYVHYLRNWTNIAGSGSGSDDLRSRPSGFALWNDNITITAPWVEIVDTAVVSQEAGRIVNNVSLAMPHIGVSEAVIDPQNNMLQPNSLSGEDIYSLSASVPSPVINVLCANLNAAELAPLIYSSWPNAVNASEIQDSYPYIPGVVAPNNQTVVDDLFGWTDNWTSGSSKQPRPVFPKLPIVYNTILNHTGSYGRESIYLLGKAPSGQPEPYALCGLKVSLTPFCSTMFNVTGSGGTMEALCYDRVDPNNGYQYIHSLPNATSGSESTRLVSPDWFNVASNWANALSLNQGVFDGNASNARLLTQLILSSRELNKSLPSLAEALAVMAGSTLLMSSQDAPFVEFWNYTATNNILTDPQTEYFNASIRIQEYASGIHGSSEDGFVVVLFVVVCLNLWALIYFIVRPGLVTDFCDSINLFALAINSPPSESLAGSCGGGPHAGHYNLNWVVNVEKDHFFLKDSNKFNRPNRWSERFSIWRSGKARRHRPSDSVGSGFTPLVDNYSKFNSR